MKHIDLVLPFSLPPSALAKDIAAALQAPSLAVLAARSERTADRECDPFARSLPHEAWLAEHFGIADATAGSPVLAPASMHVAGLRRSEGTWFIVQPVHIHISRDHLVLTDLRKLTLSDEESRALFDSAQALCAEDGKELLYGDARTWFLRADGWNGLNTATLDAACGHNIDIWLPKGDGERDWRRLQNEVQMHWHTHPVNQRREADARPSVNSLWLWGGGSTARHASGTGARIHAPHGWMHALNNSDVSNAAELLASPDARWLVMLDQLSEAALAEDWGSWIAAMNALEAIWFSPLLDGLKAGDIDRIDLVCSGNARLASFRTSRWTLKRFWHKPSFARLLS